MSNPADSAVPSPEPNVVLATFLARFVADEDAGGARPLASYQAMFPGFEDVIASEYAGLMEESGEGPRTPDRTGPENVGPYRILRELGRGGQSVVYLAEDPRLRRRVALKVLPATLLSSQRAKERFRREAELAAKLEHPGICVVLEHGECDGMPFIAMRYVEGESLAEHIATAQAQSNESEELTYLEIPDAPEPAEEAPEVSVSAAAPDRHEITRIVRLLEKVARALHSAHEEGLLHRDVKPGNIMVTPGGEPVVLDFGLARDEIRDGKTLTFSGDLMGTPAYMSPEQLLAQRIRLDRRSDVYSLGVTAYECLTLTRPFDAPTREAMYRRILTGDVPDPRRLNPAISRDLKVILETALERDRERRYPTALALAEDLRRLRTFEPIAARPAGNLIKLQRWGRRNPALATAIALVFLGLVGGFLITWHYKGHAEGQAEDLRVAIGSERRLRNDLASALEDRGRALRRSESLWLVELARKERDVDARRSASLALEAAERAPGPLTRGSLIEALMALPFITSELGEGAPYATFTPDGAHLLTVADEALLRYAVADGRVATKANLGDGNGRFLVIGPEGRRAAFLGDHRMQVVDTSSGEILAVLNAGDLLLHRAAFSPDGARLVVVGGLSTVDRLVGRVWLIDLATGEQRVLHESKTDCWSVDFDPEGERVAIGCRAGAVRVLSLSGDVVFEQETGSSIPWPAVVFSADGKRVFQLERAGFREWKLENPGASRMIAMEPSRPHSLNGIGIARSSDRRWMITWGEAKAALNHRMTGGAPAVLWDLQSGEPVRVFPGPATSAAISADGTRAAVVSGDALSLHDLRSREVEGTVALGEFKDVEWVSLDASGRRVAIVQDSGVALLDTSSMRPVPSMSGKVYDHAVSADGESFFVFDKKRGTSIFDARTLKLRRHIATDRPANYVMTSGARHFDMTGDGTRAVMKLSQAKLAWMNLESGEILRTFDGDDVEECLLTGGGTTLLKIHSRLPAKVVDRLMLTILKNAISGSKGMDPELVRSLSSKSAAELVDLKTGRTVAVVPFSSVGRLARSEDGMKILIPQSSDGTARAVVIDGVSGKTLFSVDHATVSGAFSPDGARLLLLDAWAIDGWFSAIGGGEEPVLVNATTGTEIARLDVGADRARTVAWSEDGERIAIGCEGGTLLVCDGNTGALLRALDGHRGDVKGVHFTRSGEALVSRSDDGTMRVWSTETGREILQLSAVARGGERGVFNRARFVARDRALLVIDERLRPMVVPVNPVTHARDVGVMPLSEEERAQLGL